MSNSITLSIFATETDGNMFRVFNQQDVVGKPVRVPSQFCPRYEITVPLSKSRKAKGVVIPETEITAADVNQLLQAFRDAGCVVAGTEC
jgi:hypothetical protein